MPATPEPNVDAQLAELRDAIRVLQASKASTGRYPWWDWRAEHAFDDEREARLTVALRVVEAAQADPEDPVRRSTSP